MAALSSANIAAAPVTLSAERDPEAPSLVQSRILGCVAMQHAVVAAVLEGDSDNAMGVQSDAQDIATLIPTSGICSDEVADCGVVESVETMRECLLSADAMLVTSGAVGGSRKRV